jgi:hypothetical protein
MLLLVSPGWFFLFFKSLETFDCFGDLFDGMKKDLEVEFIS